jgi:hypothetical protein
MWVLIKSISPPEFLYMFDLQIQPKNRNNDNKLEKQKFLDPLNISKLPSYR